MAPGRFGGGIKLLEAGGWSFRKSDYEEGPASTSKYQYWEEEVKVKVKVKVKVRGMRRMGRSTSAASADESFAGGAPQLHDCSNSGR